MLKAARWNNADRRMGELALRFSRAFVAHRDKRGIDATSFATLRAAIQIGDNGTWYRHVDDWDQRPPASASAREVLAKGHRTNVQQLIEDIWAEHQSGAAPEQVLAEEQMILALFDIREEERSAICAPTSTLWIA